MSKEFKLKELISLCASELYFKHRMIQIKEGGRTHVLLTPSIFGRVLWLSTPNKVLRLPREDSSLNSQGGVVNLLKDFLVQPFSMPSNLSQIDICMLVELCQGFTWIFSYLFFQDMITYIPRHVLYALPFSI